MPDDLESRIAVKHPVHDAMMHEPDDDKLCIDVACLLRNLGAGPAILDLHLPGQSFWGELTYARRNTIVDGSEEVWRGNERLCYERRVRYEHRQWLDHYEDGNARG